MKTLSEFLYTKYKHQLPNLAGVAKATISIDILELPVFDRSEYIQAVAGSPILNIKAEFYSADEWKTVYSKTLGVLKLSLLRSWNTQSTQEHLL